MNAITSGGVRVEATHGDRWPEGLAGDAVLRTDRGLRTVDELEIGTAIQTRDHGWQPLLNLVVLPAADPMTPNFMRVAVGVLGADRELRLGAGQQVLLKHTLTGALFGLTEALIRIGRLHNGEHVAAENKTSQLFHLHLPARSIIRVSGVWLATHARQAGDPLPFAELRGDSARAAGECGLFIRRPGERHARRMSLETSGHA